MDNKKCFTAFKKCNEIGKKMTPSSEYVLTNGMIIAYQNKFPKDDKDELSAYGVNISFIDNKICENLDALYYIPLLVNGSDVYRMNKEYKFDRFEVDNDYVYLIYKGLHADDSDFINDFLELGESKGFHKSYIQSEINNNFNNDIDLYELYINYKKIYKPKERYKEFKLKCKILKEKNNILKKSDEIIEKLSNCKYISEKDMDSEIYQRIINSEKPTVFRFKDNKNNDIFRVRLMKSLFKTSTTSSKIHIKILKDDEDFYYILLNIINRGFHTVIIYKAINY